MYSCYFLHIIFSSLFLYFTLGIPKISYLTCAILYKANGKVLKINNSKRACNVSCIKEKILSFLGG